MDKWGQLGPAEIPPKNSWLNQYCLRYAAINEFEFNPPKNKGFDDETNEPLIQREDDKPETVLKRLNVYHEQTKPLTVFYENLSSKGYLSFFKVDGSNSVDDFFREISSQI